MNEDNSDAVEELRTYLMNHWEAIVRRFSLNLPGCCTEGLVSHLLSERVSRDPQGWGKEGLGALTSLRIFCENGGSVDYTYMIDGKPRSILMLNSLRNILQKLLTAALIGQSLSINRPFLMEIPEPRDFSAQLDSKKVILLGLVKHFTNFKLTLSLRRFRLLLFRKSGIIRAVKHSRIPVRDPINKKRRPSLWQMSLQSM